MTDATAPAVQIPTIVQTLVDDDKRGRVISIFAMAFLGTAPLGSLLAGSLAQNIGVSYTLALSGMLCMAGALWFTRRLPLIRQSSHPIYMRMGIIPQITGSFKNPMGLSGGVR